MWKELKTNNIVNHDIFVTALDLPVSAHLEMLKTINFHVDMSSSKTINILISSRSSSRNCLFRTSKNKIKGMICDEKKLSKEKI